ncbi:Speckle-type POZ protein [Hordeum vulgare]|nr:Speckle-type POZ protein [Hordeum vulgare]
MPQGKGLGLGFDLLSEFMLLGWRKSERHIGGLVTVTINTERERKEVVPPKEQDKGKDMVPSSEVMPVQSPGMNDNQTEEPPGGKRQNYGHSHEAGGLKMNTDFSWRVTVWLLNGTVTLDQGWATFAVVHQIRIGFMVTFNPLTTDMLKIIMFNDNDIEVVIRCGKHNTAFVVNL